MLVLGSMAAIFLIIAGSLCLNHELDKKDQSTWVTGIEIGVGSIILILVFFFAYGKYKSFRRFIVSLLPLSIISIFTTIETMFVTQTADITPFCFYILC